MTDVRLCVDCLHSKPDQHTGTYYCHRPLGVSLVTGKIKMCKEMCEVERMMDYKQYCTPRGEFYAPLSWENPESTVEF